MKKIFIKPFEEYSENKLLVVGLVATFIGTLLAYILNIRFDGVLDLHVVEHITIAEVLKDLMVNSFVLITLLFLISRIINSKSRLIDIITTVLISKIPYYILTLFNVNNLLLETTNDMLKLATLEVSSVSIFSSVYTVIFSILSLLFLIWYILLLFNGFKVASNAKGIKANILFILCILLSEVFSKYLIMTL